MAPKIVLKTEPMEYIVHYEKCETGGFPVSHLFQLFGKRVGAVCQSLEKIGVL